MHRSIVYDTELGQVTDFLNVNKFAMLGQAFANQAMLGNSTVVAGLVCAPTGPASLNVTVGMGSIYALDEVDATAYGDLGTDTTVILKQGILYSPVTLTVTPPSTSGYSQVFLVQAILQDVDAGSSVLPYYNAAIPSEPFSGPANDGASQYTIRECLCTIALKAGTAAPTGSQTIPSPDAGYVGLYYITVSNGQATITSANITLLPTAPFFPTLPSIPGDIQNGLWISADDTSPTANTVTLTPSPPITSYQKYQRFSAKIANTNTNASVININGVGNVAIILPSGAALVGGEMKAGSIAMFECDGSAFELVSSPANNNTGGGGGGGGGGTGITTSLANVINVTGSAPGGTTTASWSVEQVTAVTVLGGTPYVGKNLSLSFGGSSVGVNGMDTGSVPVSADLSVYAIYNPTSGTWATLGCNGTVSRGEVYAGANMPAGYTASALLFTGKTDGSGYVNVFYQANRKVWVSPCGSAGAYAVAGGGATSPTSFSAAAFVPYGAKTCWGGMGVSGTTSDAYVGGISVPNLTGTGPTNSVLGAQVVGQVSSNNSAVGEIPFCSPQTLYYFVWYAGQTIDFYITGYSF